jgi:arylsulfatase A-like enzyme
MTSTRTSVFAFLIGACSLAACSPDSDKPATVKMHIARVELAAPAERETPEQEVQSSRRSILRVTSEVRDAWVAPLDQAIDMDFDAPHRERFVSAVGILGATETSPVPKGRVLVDIVVTSGKLVRKLPLTVDAAKARTEWEPFEAVVGADDPVHVHIECSFVWGEPEGVPGAKGLRLCVALPSSAATGPAKAAPNVLVISVDALRADHLGCYGYARPTSPRIDALVAKGVLFEHACSPAPWTLPSYGSLFTALWPAEHRAGIITEREAAWGKDETAKTATPERLRGDVPTLAELFAKRGFTTAALYANPFLGPKAGTDRGFAQYTAYQYNAKNGIDLATQWLDEHSDERFFLFVHLMDPHWPYAPPSPFDGKFGPHKIDDMKSWPPSLSDLRKNGASDEMKSTLVDLYDGEIAFADSEIGRLLDELDKLELSKNTIVVFHSDHGEEFWEHGGCDHGHSQYEELLRVPLAIVWPARFTPSRVATRVRTLDVMPTLFELAGIPGGPSDAAGKSLVPVIERRETEDRPALSEGILNGPREIKAWTQGHDKLIASGGSEDRLFDLGADPKELKDRAAQASELRGKLRAELEKHHTNSAQSAQASAKLQLDDEEVQRLKRIGYLGADEDKPNASKPPKPNDAKPDSPGADAHKPGPPGKK